MDVDISQIDMFAAFDMLVSERYETVPDTAEEYRDELAALFDTYGRDIPRDEAGRVEYRDYE